VNIATLPETLRTGTCPFTGKPYACARCDFKRTRLPYGMTIVHTSLCITGPIDGRGWRDVLRFFDYRDRPEAKKLIGQLLQLGAETIPVGACDLEHFCFKHGCMGHPEKGTNGTGGTGGTDVTVARKAPGEEGTIKTVYRVESEDGKLGLWRDADGTWNPKFHLLRDGKCKDMPMEDSEVYREGGKRWFASAPSRELLKEWFSMEDLCDLKKHGFGIYEFEVSQWKFVSEFECIFPRDAVVGRKKIGISEIYEEAEDGNS